MLRREHWLFVRRRDAFAGESKINKKRIVLPGAVAVLMGEVEESLAGWQVEVGPREAVDVPAYLKLKP